MIPGSYDCIVKSNEQVFGNLYVMSLASKELAEGIEPGQFIHLNIPDLQAHILRRPFSVLDANPLNGTIEVLYQVKGAGTDEMSKWEPGYEPNALGPLGKPWGPSEGVGHALLAGGGVGAAPLLMLAKQLSCQGATVDVAIAATTKDALVCLSRYEEIATGQVRCATDDGSFGHHGFCTALVEEFVAESESTGNPYGYIAICGPEPMMVACGKAARRSEAAVQVSLERRMACGIGACLSCVANTTSGMKRVCKEGPIFDFSEVVW